MVVGVVVVALDLLSGSAEPKEREKLIGNEQEDGQFMCSNHHYGFTMAPKASACIH